MQSLPEKALQWGHDFIDGLVQGIKDKIGAVTEAVSGVGEKIKSFLHFSVPDEGPLTDYESWMPDFMEGLAKGIKKNSPMVYKAVSALAKGISRAKNAMREKLDDMSPTGHDAPNPSRNGNGLGGMIAGLQKGRILIRGLSEELRDGLAESAAGFAADLMGHARKAVPVLKKIVKTAMPLADISVKGATRAAIQGGGNRTTNVQQTNHITNKFEGGDRAAQTEGAKAMGKTAKDTTAQMARALATGR